MKVTIIDSKTGRERVMEERFAKVLVGMKKATYLTGNRPTYITRDMRADLTPTGIPAETTVVLSEDEPVASADTTEDPAEEFDDITEARAETDTQEPAVAPRRRGRPRKEAE